MAHWISIIVSFLSSKAHAQALQGDEGTIEGKFCDYFGRQLHSRCGDNQAFLANIAIGIGDMITLIIPAVCVLAVIWGGIRMTASGIDESGREEGKNIIKFALIGLVLALAAGVIINYVADFVRDTIPES